MLLAVKKKLILNRFLYNQYRPINVLCLRPMVDHIKVGQKSSNQKKCLHIELKHRAYRILKIIQVQISEVKDLKVV